VRKPLVERRAHQRRQPPIVEQPGLGQPTQVENAVADRDPDARLLAAGREHAQRQILNREVGMAIGAVDPAGPRGVVGFVGHAGHGKVAFGKSAQLWS
jgi:hypothetical protein